MAEADPQISGLEQEPNPAMPVTSGEPKNNRRIIAVFSFILGVLQILITFIFFVFVFPQLHVLYASLNLQISNAYLPYVTGIVLTFTGIVNIFAGIKVLNQANYTREAILILISTFIMGGFLVAAMILSVILPIYSLLGQIQ